MMDNLEAFKEEFQEVTRNAEFFCYMTRAAEFQLAAHHELERLQAKANELKEQAIIAENEDAANQLLCYERIANALISELDMWLALKDDKMNEAWNFLINSQDAVRSAMQAHVTANHLEDYAERLFALETLLFPPQMFQSVGIIVKKVSCSICGKNYENCEHIAGRPYLGKLCGRHISECELIEASIVTNPANKMCRAITISGKDVMTWRSVNDEEST